MEKTEDLEKLAEICLATAKTIKQYLASNGLPQMSFGQNGPAFFPAANPEVQHARMALREAARTLCDLAAGPDDVMTVHQYQCVHDLNAFRYATRFKIFEAVPLDSTISYAELASKIGVNAGQLKPTLRKLMHIHVFCEPQVGQVAHTAASKLYMHPGVGSFTAYVSEDTWMMASRQIEALQKWGHGSQEPNEAALQYYYNTGKPMFQYYEQDNPVAREMFSKMMTYVSSMYPMSNLHVAKGYDWASLGEATVCDVAGNIGHCSIPIAQANPKAKVIVQDLPLIVKRAQDPATCVIPEELRDRITFMAHNFYDPQPVEADVYFLRMIMHDYSDKYCIRILKQLVAAMKPGSRLIINDQMLPPVGGAPDIIERFMRCQDLQMMMLSNAKERAYEEWTDLFKSTDPRLKIKNVITPPGSVMSFLEVVLNEGVDGHA